MDVLLPDGTKVENVPEGTTKAQLLEKLRAGGYTGNLEAPTPVEKLPTVPGASADKGGKTQGIVQGLRDSFDAAAQLGVRQASGHPLIGRLLPQNAVEQVDAPIAERNAVYDDSRRLAGREGFDWARLTGNVINPANIAGGRVASGINTVRSLATQPVRQTALQVARGGGAAGALGGAMTPVTNTEDFGTTKATQIGVGTVGGALLAPPLSAVGERVGRLVLRARDLVSRPSDAAILTQTNHILQQWAVDNGFDLATIPQSMLANVQRQVADAVRARRVVDPGALIRQGDFEALGMRGTQGQIGRDPAQFTREQNLKGVEGAGEPLRQRFMEQNRQLTEHMDRYAQGAASRDVAGEQVVGALRGVDDAAGNRVTGLYNAARSLNGGEIALDGAGFVNRASAALDAQMRGAFLPEQVRGMLQDIANGRLPLNIATAEQLRTILATASRASNDGNVRHALGLVRDALEQTGPVIPNGAAGMLPSRAGDVTSAFAAARAANAARMGAREQVPALGAAVDDAARDNFITRHVINADTRDTQRLLQTLQGNPEALAQIRAQVAEHLRHAALKTNETGDRVFLQHGFNEALRKLGPTKLAAIFGDEGARELMRIGRVAANISSHPATSTVNTSGTAAALMNLLQGLAGRIPGSGLVGAGLALGTTAARTAGNARFATNALNGGVPTHLSPEVAETMNRLLVGPAALGTGAALGSAVNQ